MPRKVTSAYIYYVSENVPIIRKERNLSITDGMIAAAKMWKLLDDRAKQPYIEKSNADKQRFDE